MAPLLIASGPGAEERRSIAVLVCGGQALSLLLTLLAVPVIYSLLDDVGLLWRRRTAPAAVRPPVRTSAPELAPV
jgi:HAE1 family hydrophobic/amphiphilic exporter-1